MNLLERLIREKEGHISGGIYHKVQIELTYNSNHMEGSSLTHEQTRYIFETNTIGAGHQNLNVDDIIETVNHFRCIDMMIDQAKEELSEEFILDLHRVLKTGTSDARKSWFPVGNYKSLPNEVGGLPTTDPSDVKKEMRALLKKHRTSSFEDILDFHYRFERIHPFQDGNGRVGRLIMFMDCLKHDIVPFIITDDLKMFYYRGLKEWEREKGFLIDTCLTAQDRFRAYLQYFKIDCK